MPGGSHDVAEPSVASTRARPACPTHPPHPNPNSFRRRWGYRISGADEAQLEALAAKPALMQHRVQELVFDNLTVR